MKQTVYIKAESTDKVVDTFALTKIGDKSFIHFISKHEGYFFTEEQLKQLLIDYTNKIVENAEITSGEGINIENVSIDKESITNQLELFLKNKYYV